MVGGVVKLAGICSDGHLCGREKLGAMSKLHARSVT